MNEKEYEVLQEQYLERGRIDARLNVLSFDNNLDEMLKNTKIVDSPGGKVRRGFFWLTEALARELHLGFWGVVLVEDHYFKKSDDWCPRDNVWIRDTAKSIYLKPPTINFSRNNQNIPWREMYDNTLITQY